MAALSFRARVRREMLRVLGWIRQGREMPGQCGVIETKQQVNFKEE